MITPERATEITEKFAALKLVVVGDAVLDHYIFGAVERLNPEAPVPILHAREAKHMPGGAGNVAKNAAQLGAATTLVSVVGVDAKAENLKTTTENEGISTYFLRDESRPTTEKIRYLVGSQQLLRVDYEEVHDIEGDTEASVIEGLESEVPKAHGVIVSDYAKGVITKKTAEAIMRLSHEHSIPVMADSKPSHINYFTGADYISPNRKEAHEYLGLNQFDKGGQSPADLAGQLYETFDASTFLTVGADGMYVRTDEADDHLTQSYVTDDLVVDPSGCGDTAATVILLAKLAGATDVEAGELANAAGASVARKVGSVGLTVPELVHTIAHNHA